MPDTEERTTEERSDSVKQCLELLDELEAMTSGARRFMFQQNQRIIDLASYMERLQLLRQILPASVRKAAAVLNEVDALRQNANEEAKLTKDKAQREADQLRMEANEYTRQANAQLAQASGQAQAITTDAQNQAQKIINDGKMQAESIIKQAQAQAQEQAQSILNKAQLEAEQLKSQEQVYIRAQMDAERLREESETAAADLRRKTFDYLEGMVNQVEQYMGAVLTDVHQEHENLRSHR